MGVNANKLPLPTTRNSRNRNQKAVALSYRIEFWLFVCIVTVMTIGLWITVLITNEYTGIRLKEAIEPKRIGIPTNMTVTSKVFKLEKII